MTPPQNSNRGAVLITGAAKRIGKELALALASFGYDIALHCNSSRKDAEKAARLIEKNGRRCKIYECDLLNTTEASSLIKLVKKDFPNFNLLINNASIFIPSAFKSVSLEELDRDMTIHVRTPFLLIQNFSQICQHGQVINILDSHIVENKTKHFTYLLAKKTLAELTKMAAVDLGPDMRVNAIAPGPILPPLGIDGKEIKKKLGKNSPLKRQGSTNEIIQTVLFLIQNTYLTGQIIFNDGGESLV
jgi:NAD(P)-dependent dehydrogenase (short-subunit alcohol dehydrogenase family)